MCVNVCIGVYVLVQIALYLQNFLIFTRNISCIFLFSFVLLFRVSHKKNYFLCSTMCKLFCVFRYQGKYIF